MSMKKLIVQLVQNEIDGNNLYTFSLLAQLLLKSDSARSVTRWQFIYFLWKDDFQSDDKNKRQFLTPKCHLVPFAMVGHYCSLYVWSLLV